MFSLCFKGSRPFRQEHPTGDRRKQALRVQFDGKLKLEFHGSKITSDAGLFAFRELDEAFRLTENGRTLLSACRQGKNTQHTILALLRQGVYGRLAGYEDVNDADHLRVDPAMRRIVGGRAKEKEAASTSEMSRFETEMLSSKENLTALMNLSGTWIDSVHQCAPLDKPILDLDSSGELGVVCGDRGRCRLVRTGSSDRMTRWGPIARPIVTFNDGSTTVFCRESGKR